MLGAILTSLGVLTQASRYRVTVVATLAITLAGVTLIFSIVNGFLFRPLKSLSDVGVVSIYEFPVGRGAQGKRPVSWSVYKALNERSTAFSRMGALRVRAHRLHEEGGFSLVYSASVTEEVMTILHVRAALGTVIGPGWSGPPPVMLSHEIWVQRFASDPSVIGRELHIDDSWYQAVGVLPPDFQIPGTYSDTAPGLYTLQRQEEVESMPYKTGPQFTVIASLRSGIDAGQAAADVGRVGSLLAAEYPGENAGISYGAEPFRHRILDGFRSQLYWVLGAACLLLTLGCCNVANLILTRWIQAERDTAIRLALGASPWRIVVRIFRETGLIVLLGAGCAAVISIALMPGVRHILPPVSAHIFDLKSFDLRIFAFLGLVCSGICALVGTLPALYAQRLNVERSLRGGSSKFCGQERGRWAGSVLIVVQVTISTALLGTTILLVHSLRNADEATENAAFSDILTFRVGLDPNSYGVDQDRALAIESLLAELARLPGVVAASSMTPELAWPGQGGVKFQRGRDTQPFESATNYAADFVVARSFCATVGLRVVEGRSFGTEDRPETQRGVMVSAELGRRYWGSESPVGEMIRFQREGAPQVEEAVIVGVVENLAALGPRPEPLPAIIHLMDQVPPYLTNILLRTSGADPLGLQGSVRAIIQRHNSGNSVYRFNTLEGTYAASRWQVSMIKSLLLVFGSLAFALAIGGVYSVFSYSVTQRLPEFGLRMALGSSTANVARLVVMRSLKIVSIGLAVGLVLAVVLGNALRSLLFEVEPLHPPSLALVALLIGAATLVASLLPAWRGSRAPIAEVFRA